MEKYAGFLRLNEAFQYVDDRFLDIVEQERQKAKKKGRTAQKKPLWMSLSAAAAGICLFLVLPVVAVACNWFRLRDLILPKQVEKPVDITFWDYMYRPEVRAVREWESFLAGYDPEGKIFSETEREGFYAEGREDWKLYDIYSSEMGEKLDEIAGRYKLTLHTEKYTITPQELETMVGGKFVEGSAKEEVDFYEDGSFLLEGSTELAEYGMADFRFRCAVKGSFDRTAPFLWRDEGDEEWQYTTACGEPLLLVLGDSRALIYAEFEQCLITVDMNRGRDGGMRPEDLQELADQVDFVLLKGSYASELGRDFKESPEDIITLSGYPGSPEALAAAEWEEFYSGYDIDGVLRELGCDIFYVEGREDWSLYSVYSQEMGERLDEIVNKYGLKLHREINIVSPQEMDYRVGGRFLDEGCIRYVGYIYEDGSFALDGDAGLEGCGMTGFQFRRMVKGTFDGVVLNIDNVEDYTDWQYQSASGETVMLSLGHIKALIFADFEECFVEVNVLAGRNEGMTEADLQKLADMIDFRVLKEVQIPDMRGDSE